MAIATSTLKFPSLWEQAIQLAVPLSLPNYRNMYHFFKFEIPELMYQSGGITGTSMDDF